MDRVAEEMARRQGAWSKGVLARLEAGKISKRRLARGAGLTPSNLNRLLARSANPTLESVVRVELALTACELT